MDFIHGYSRLLSICITNMVIVFAVLIFLAFVIELIHVVDPTKRKNKNKLNMINLIGGIKWMVL